MLESLRLTAAPSVVLLALMTGCSIEQTQVTSPSPTPTPSLPTQTAPSPVASKAPSPSSQTDPFQDASDKAIGAATVSQSAQSKYDWEIVFGMWEEAITLMKSVPKSSPSYAGAQKKVSEYQLNLVTAKQNAKKPQQVVEPDLAVAKQNAGNSPEVVKPVSQTSVSQPQEPPQQSKVPAGQEFMEAYLQASINEGSKGYEYWCSKSTNFVSSLFAPRGWQILKADNDYALVRVDSSNKGGSQITANWNFYLDKETDKKHTGLPRGLCINLMSEQH